MGPNLILLPSLLLYLYSLPSITTNAKFYFQPALNLALPLFLRVTGSIDYFKRHLKTLLFRQAFSFILL